MNRTGLLICLIAFSTASINAQQGFKTEQQSYSRVKAAYNEKYDGLKEHLDMAGINIDRLELYFRAYKLDRKLEVWARNRGESSYMKVFTYQICRLSGTAGPKRQQGDLQVPEGFYHIRDFNPWSNFHLSMGINYPNKSDRILKNGDPGGDIYIHGSCATIGCLPITDDCIKELYVLCVEARNNGQEKIPVTIFPTVMSRESVNELKRKYDPDENTAKLWESLLKAEELFSADRGLPTITFRADGTHEVK